MGKCPFFAFLCCEMRGKVVRKGEVIAFALSFDSFQGEK